MNLSFTFFRRLGQREQWTLLGAHGVALSRSGRSFAKLEQHLREDLRKLVKDTPVSEVRTLERAASLTLTHVRLELDLSGEHGKRTLSGRCPLIVEQRLSGQGLLFELAYHPERKADWFWLPEGADLAVQAERHFQETLRELDDGDVQALFSHGREVLHTISISGTLKEPKLEKPRRQRAAREPERKPVLSTLGVDRTEAVETFRETRFGVTRTPFRAELSQLLSGVKKRSTLVIGESGSGRSTLIDQAVHDLLVAEDFPSHRNLDQVHHVIQLAGRQLIAGMSYAGDWEQRCFDLFREAKNRKVILWITDLATFGRTGRSRQSDRSLAEVFRGPIARGELCVVAELTASELARLEEDAPGFSELFARVTLPPSGPDETFRMLVREARNLEAERPVRFGPHALSSILDLSSSLVTSRVQPGAALDWLARIARVHAQCSHEIAGSHVLEFVASHTGLRRVLFDRAQALDFHAVYEALERRVLGQPGAVARAAELVLRIKAGLTDPRRPYGVFLFTGPTGTGKTELAKALSAYLYGSDTRLLRFDMGEYTDESAAGRLIGELGGPDGLLTRALGEQPFCVVLFDEIEKAHRSVFPLLLQVLDEGRLSDAQGRTVSFRNAVVVMTSNLGARTRPQPGFGGEALASAPDVARAVREFFAPEFVNRIDHTVSFVPLSLEHARTIVRRELSRLCARPGLRDRNAIVLSDDAAIARIAEEAFRAEDGARSLRRFLEDRVASVLADAIARAPDGALRLVHLHATDAGFFVHQHRLEEAPPLAARFALEPLLGRPLRELYREVPRALAELERMAESPLLPALAEHIRDSLSAHLLSRRVGDAELYSLDFLRGELATLRELLAPFALSESEHALREAEARADFVVTRDHTGADVAEAVRVRSEAPRGFSRADLLATLSRVAFLRRALSRARETGAHSVEISLLAVPALPREQAGLLVWLAAAFARAHGELDSFAVYSAGAVVSGESLAELARALGPGSTCVVLRMAGPLVHDFFAPEDGMHVFVPSSRDAELVRVCVAKVDLTVSPAQRARAQVGELARGEASSLLATQLTRLVRFEPPEDEGDTSILELEDYPQAHVSSSNVRTLAEALEPLFLLRLSREDYAP